MNPADAKAPACKKERRESGFVILFILIGLIEMKIYSEIYKFFKNKERKLFAEHFHNFVAFLNTKPKLC